MSFYIVGPRQDYASYWPEKTDGQISAHLIPTDSRVREVVLREYLGDPPRRPAKRGEFHRSAFGYFIREDLLPTFLESANGRMLCNPTLILGRESEKFVQIWITNEVDCLNIGETDFSPTVDKRVGKFGVIRRPAFDMDRWDGSDLFVVPEDPNQKVFCSAQFIKKWKELKTRGMMFARHFMDCDPIIS